MTNHKKNLFGKRYEVLEEIGQGGMGRVYKVYDTVRAENLALKEMSHRHLDSPVAMLRFKNEFRIMSGFQHPNTVQVFEFGISQENVPFITMEFVSGADLSELSGLDIEQVIDILAQICQILAYIHSRLYVHRDLKPENIKLLENSSIKLLDYGLISQLGIPASGKISGTYYYLAPEVIAGGIIDESTDLYSLGVIGYELLTGQRPFTGGKTEILQGHLKRTALEPANIRTDIPPSVNAIIMKLLEKDKEHRYRNAWSVLEDLQYVTGKTYLVETTAQKRGYLYSSKLVGREKEIARFKRHLRRLIQGQSTSLFIGAPAGIGKTRLLKEMKTLTALAGVRSLYLDSQQAGDRIYGWIDGLLQQIILTSDEQEIQSCGMALAQISAAVDARLSGSAHRANEQEMVEAIVAWFTTVTRQAPLVLFLDDAHWMNSKSLQVLNKLIRSKDEFRALIVTSFRNDEVEKTSPLWHTIEEELSDYVELSPLSKQQTRALMETLLYPTAICEEFLTYSFRNCGGNVFELMELLRYMITETHLAKSGGQWLEPVNIEALSLPAELADHLILRMNRLSAETRALAGVAAVLGDALDLENWQVVSRYEENRFFQAIDDLMHNQIIIKGDGDYQFSHDKIRSILYENLSETQKKDYHSRAAKFLEGKLADNNQELIPTIARHFVTAQDSQQAIEYSLRAAKAAERNNAEWKAFDHYRDAAQFLEENLAYPDREALLLGIYEKAAQFSSAAWIDAATCLRWLQKAIDFYTEKRETEQIFDLSLSYVVTSTITSNYAAARRKVTDIIEACEVREKTLLWAILYGAGVCLVDWYQGYQNDCFDHAAAAIDIFESQLDDLPASAWPAYSWALFWRDKARAYLGKAVDMNNVEKIRQLMLEGKSDETIYWHTLTAVGARAAFTGRWADLLAWKQLASDLSRKMGKIYWFECWISHSYLYGALHHGEFSQLKNHIERVQASPDPYQVRLAYLFRGRWHLIRGSYGEAEQNLDRFLQLEEDSRDNSFLEGLVYLAQTYLATGAVDKAKKCVADGARLAEAGEYANPLYRLQFLQLEASLAISAADCARAERLLIQSLELAEELDNPIQAGFVHKLWGALLLEQNDLEKAEEHLRQARNVFLSLDNKYQAGQVVTLLEPLARLAEHGAEVKMDTDTSLPTEFGEEKATTQVEVNVISETQTWAGETHPDSKTEIEDIGLETTEAEL